MNDTSTLKPGHIQGETGIWEMVIGLEIHAQISSKSKLFSGASASLVLKLTEMYPWWMLPCLGCYQLSMSSV